MDLMFLDIYVEDQGEDATERVTRVDLVDLVGDVLDTFEPGLKLCTIKQNLFQTVTALAGQEFKRELVCPWVAGDWFEAGGYRVQVFQTVTGRIWLRQISRVGFN